MKAESITPKSVDEYISLYPANIQQILKLDKPLPLELIAKIVRFRVYENLELAKK